MMVHTGLSDQFWAEAVECAASIWNHTPTSAVKGNWTPLEVKSGEKPDASHFKLFGCIAYTHVPDAQWKKLDKKAMTLRLVGYSIQSKCYRLLDEETSRIYARRDVVINEQTSDVEPRVSCTNPSETVEIQPSSDGILKQEEQAKPLQRRQSERIRPPPVRYGIDEYVEAAADSIQHLHVYSACQIVKTQTMEEALVDDCSEVEASSQC